MNHFLDFLLLRILLSPLSLFSYRIINILGKGLGTIIYYTSFPKLRKMTMSNLALVKEFHLNNSNIRALTKKSFQNLAIICLEFIKFEKDRDLSKIKIVENCEKIDEIIKKGKGVIICSGHQRNLELFFLKFSAKHSISAIAKSPSNRFINNFILKIRQKCGGEIISPKRAIKKSIKLLNEGICIGICGDRGRPLKDQKHLFFGRPSWFTPLPAILSYKTKTPIIFVSSQFKDGAYHFHYSDPIYPNTNNPWKQEVKKTTEKLISLLESSIKKCPEQWILWHQPKWKQQDYKQIRKSFCLDSLAIFLPHDELLVTKASIFRKFYPTEFIAIFVPKDLENHCTIDAEIHTYTDPKECFHNDLRFKLIFNFTDIPKLEKHYKKLSTLKTVSLHTYENLEALLKP